MGDKLEVIEKKLSEAKIALESEKVEMKKIMNQAQAQQNKFQNHSDKAKKLEAQIEAYNSLLCSI